jgi:hypothetical protein
VTAAKTNPLAVTHTYDYYYPNPILTRTPNQIGNTTGSDSAFDVAILRLDLPVSSHIAPPLHPTGLGDAPICPSLPGGLGLLVGYGSNSLFGGGNDFTRAYLELSGWGTHAIYKPDPSADMYWETSTQFFDYSGISKGDSGGPLLYPNGSFVCGVISRYAPDGVTDPNTIDEDAADLGSDYNVQFLADNLLDPVTHQFIGECPPGSPDFDHDGFPDDCDNCPGVPNEIQTDTDHDGIGDACDNCYTIPNFRQAGSDKFTYISQPDINFYEEVIANGGAPVFPPPSNSYLTSNFPGDVCDPNPITVVANSGMYYSDSTNTRTISQAVHTGPCTIHITKRTVGFGQTNTIHAEEAVGTAGSQSGLTRMAVCMCPIGNSDALCASSTYGCARSNVETPDRAAWTPMTLHDATTQILQTIPKTGGLVPTLHQSIQNAGRDATGALWAANQVDWGWAYWADIPESVLGPAVWHPVPGDPSTFDSVPVDVYDGVMWSWVRNFVPYPATPGPNDMITTTGEVVRQNTGRIEIIEQGSPDVNANCPPPAGLVYIRNPDYGACPMCNGSSFLAVDPTNPGDPSIETPGVPPRARQGGSSRSRRVKRVAAPRRRDAGVWARLSPARGSTSREVEVAPGPA